MRKTSGFTLIEIVVWVSIIVMIFFVSIPALNNMVQVFALKAVARDILSDLRFAQEKAIAGKCTVAVEFVPKTLLGEPATYYIKKAGVSKSRTDTIRVTRVSRKFDFAQGKTFKFSSSGFPPAGGSGTMVVEDTGGRKKSVILSSAGRVRME